MIGIKLLNLAFDARLGRIFDKDIAAQQDILVQLSLAGAIAANGINVHAGADHIVG